MNFDEGLFMLNQAIQNKIESSGLLYETVAGYKHMLERLQKKGEEEREQEKKGLKLKKKKKFEPYKAKPQIPEGDISYSRKNQPATETKEDVPPGGTSSFNGGMQKTHITSIVVFLAASVILLIALLYFEIKHDRQIEYISKYISEQEAISFYSNKNELETVFVIDNEEGGINEEESK